MVQKGGLLCGLFEGLFEVCSNKCYMRFCHMTYKSHVESPYKSFCHRPQTDLNQAPCFGHFCGSIPSNCRDFHTVSLSNMRKDLNFSLPKFLKLRWLQIPSSYGLQVRDHCMIFRWSIGVLVGAVFAAGRALTILSCDFPCWCVYSDGVLFPEVNHSVNLYLNRSSIPPTDSWWRGSRNHILLSVES